MLVTGDALHAQADTAADTAKVILAQRGGYRAILRRLTLDLLDRARPKMSVSRKRKRSGSPDAFARSIIGGMQ